MIAMRSLTWRTIARLWVTIIAASRSSRFRSVIRLSTSPCTETSSPAVGSSAMHQFRIERQRAGDADAARLAAGEFVRKALGEGGGQADLREQLGRLRALSGSATPWMTKGSASSVPISCAG